MKRLGLTLAFALVALFASSSEVPAKADGFFDGARPGTGCTCHGGIAPPPNTTTRPVIVGLPLVDGYVPGETYALQLVVVGVTVPLGTEARAGFNVEATAGELEEVDPALIQARHRSECEVLRSIVACNTDPDAGAVTCGVEKQGGDPDPSCTRATQCLSRHCDSPGVGDCRVCRDEIVDIQATHTARGNDDFIWDVLWHAPDPGVGEVTFYMAGNFVNGDGKNDHDPLDVWSVAPELVVPQAD